MCDDVSLPSLVSSTPIYFYYVIEGFDAWLSNMYLL